MNLIKKIFLPTALTISSLLLIYTFYKSEIYWNGDIRDYYFTYYILSSILIFFSIITFFINQKIKEYLIISGITLVVSLYLFEGYLTFQLSKDQLSKVKLSKEQLSKEQSYEKQTGTKWDKRRKIEIYEDLKKMNNEITISVFPNLLLTDPLHLDKYNQIFPLSGISKSKTILCNENGYFSIYQSDRYGFNNPDEEWDNKKIEYLLVGDSFTHGSCVNRPNDIASILRTLSNKSVLNLAYGGNGPLIEYATLREYLNTNVKKVLWIYYDGNDLEDLTSEKSSNILINYLNDLTFTQNLKLKQNEINNLAINLIDREIDRERENIDSKLIKFIKIYNIRRLIFHIPRLEPASAPEFKKILQLSKDLTIKNNSKLYFVSLHGYSRYKIKYDNTNYNLVKNIVNELNIPFIDIHKEVFEKEQNPLKLFPYFHRCLCVHYTVEGYKKVAETIYKFTKD